MTGASERLQKLNHLDKELRGIILKYISKIAVRRGEHLSIRPQANFDNLNTEAER